MSKLLREKNTLLFIPPDIKIEKRKFKNLFVDWYNLFWSRVFIKKILRTILITFSFIIFSPSFIIKVKSSLSTVFFNIYLIKDIKKPEKRLLIQYLPICTRHFEIKKVNLLRYLYYRRLHIRGTKKT